MNNINKHSSALKGKDIYNSRLKASCGKLPASVKKDATIMIDKHEK